MFRKSLMALAIASLAGGSALAAVSADEAKQLGTTLTAVGAEKAGNKDVKAFAQDMVRDHEAVNKQALDLVKNRQTREMLVPYNAAGAANAPMVELIGACKSRGLMPFTNYNRLHVVPPCTISEAEMKDGLAILDDAFTAIDKHYQG